MTSQSNLLNFRWELIQVLWFVGFLMQLRLDDHRGLFDLICITVKIVLSVITVTFGCLMIHSPDRECSACDYLKFSRIQVANSVEADKRDMYIEKVVGIC